MHRRPALRPALLREQAREALRVDGPRWARRTADLASVGALLSLLAGFWYGPVAVALVALLLFGVVLVRVAPLPGPLQAVMLPALVAAAWAGMLDGYQTVPFLDVVAHVVINGLLAIVMLALLTGRPLGRRGPDAPNHSRGQTVLITTALGALLATCWEIAEWAGHTFVDRDVFVGYDDTIGDLAAGVVGSMLAGLLLGRFLRSGTERDR